MPTSSVDEVCDAFEAAWLAGQKPQIEDFLSRIDSGQRDVLLRELMLAEWDLRRRHGQHTELEEYQGRFPDRKDAVTDLWRVWKEMPSQSVPDAPSLVEPALTAAAPCEAPGSIIGRYKLLEKLGEGGFGVVWAAEQREPVKRRVALKVIKLGMDTRQIIARFEAERQALALMDHANIAKVFDADATGPESECPGRPYFVMELVRGIAITQYCDENNLSTIERLGLFIAVCRAIQHAHQKGVIHRDIKPTNILVTLHDGVPVPKVIDFGIAKAIHNDLTDKTIYTQFQQFIGTPAYISPEQAEMSGLDVDTRSDIYSLGVLLYELLTGKTPFDAKELVKAGLDEMRRTIREQEPMPPSTRLSGFTPEELTTTARRRSGDGPRLINSLRGDLDCVVMKCLEKDRSRRYETASGLAMDIERYLADEPVLACPPSAAYQLRKFVRRNKGPVLAALLVLLALVAGVIGTTWGLVRAEQQRLIVEEQRNELAERNQALEEAHEKERLLNERARQAIETVASDTAIDQLTRQKELRPEQKEFLDKMIQYYAESAEEGAATEQERSRQAQAYHRIGRLNHILDRFQDSETAYRRAIALGQQLAADFPARLEYRLKLALSHNALGTLLYPRRPPEAESAYADALAILRQLAVDFPDRPEFRQPLAGIYNNLGGLFHETGRPKEAEDAHVEALAIRKQLAAELPDARTIRRALAMSHNNLGWLFRSTNRLEKAESAYRDAVAAQRRAVADFPDRPEFRMELGGYLFNLDDLLRAIARPKEAEAAHAEALAILKQLVADYPNRPEFRQKLAERGLLEDGGRAGDEGKEKSTSEGLGASDFPKK